MAPRKLKKMKGSSGPHLRPPDTEKGSPFPNKPVFSLHQMRHPYCVDDCDADDKKFFADALWRRSQLTWTELTLSRKHGLGSEQIAQGAIKEQLPSTVTPDVTLLAFRFSGMKAMVGYRDGETFHILWLDHSFALYDHGS